MRLEKHVWEGRVVLSRITLINSLFVRTSVCMSVSKHKNKIKNLNIEILADIFPLWIIFHTLRYHNSCCTFVVFVFLYSHFIYHTSRANRFFCKFRINKIRINKFKIAGAFCVVCLTPNCAGIIIGHRT